MTVRPWRMEDIPALVAACQDPEIPRWTMVPSPYTDEDGRSFIEDCLRGDDSEQGFAIADASGGDLLGSIGYRLLREHVAEVGYWLAAAARGRGVTTRAVRLLCNWLFEDLRLARIQLLAEPDNVASWRVAERVGFTREGLLRSWTEMKGRRRDFYIYSLLPGEPRPGK